MTSNQNSDAKIWIEKNAEKQKKMITKSDFKDIGEVAIHCDLPKLEIAINEAENFDLANLFCDFWNEINAIDSQINIYKQALKEHLECLKNQDEYQCIPPEIPQNYELKLNLINGGNYIGCNGKSKNHFGVKKILAYYAYARYCIINNFNDTPNGNVSKSNDFSIPKTLKELELFADKYRTMGYQSYKKTLNFICHNKDVFKETKSLPCKSCGCGCESCGETKAKGYGIRGSIITKKI